MKYLTLLLLVVLATVQSEELETYLAHNDKIVKSELGKLSVDSVGKRIKSITLSDGVKILKGYIFIGARKNDGGANVYLFKTPQGSLEAYLWSDKKTLTLPSCDEALVGEGQYVLSGDVYTWKKLNFGYVVHSLCPLPEWID